MNSVEKQTLPRGSWPFPKIFLLIRKCFCPQNPPGPGLDKFSIHIILYPVEFIKLFMNKKIQAFPRDINEISPNCFSWLWNGLLEMILALLPGEIREREDFSPEMGQGFGGLLCRKSGLGSSLFSRERG